MNCSKIQAILINITSSEKSAKKCPSLVKPDRFSLIVLIDLNRGDGVPEAEVNRTEGSPASFPFHPDLLLTSFANLTYSSRALMAASVNLTRTTLFFALCCSLPVAPAAVGLAAADDDDSREAVAFCSND